MSGFTASGVAGVGADIGGAVGDLYSASGDLKSVGEYEQAEDIAQSDVELEKAATGIKEAQQQRQFEQTIGSQQAQIGGAGFGASGTAMDLFRSSTQQGALAHATIATQGLVNENSYQQQANAFGAEASAARAAAQAGLVGGIIKGVEAVGSVALMAA